MSTASRERTRDRLLQGDAASVVDETEGNERLTAATGVLLALIGVTLLNLRLLIWGHLFIGMPGHGARVIMLASAVAAGLVLAIVLIPDFGAWTSSHALLHHHHHDG